MKKDIKQEILCNARNLFNEHGYNEISMRNIADSLNISVGNLTYHFKKKEELVEAVLMEQHKNYRKPSIPTTLEELNQFFIRILTHHSENPYYFRHYTQLAQLCPNVYQLQLKVMQDFHDVLIEGFQRFRKAGIMKPEELPGQTDRIVKALLTVSIYGFPNVKNSENKSSVNDSLLNLWSLIYSLLTQQGQMEYTEKVILK